MQISAAGPLLLKSSSSSSSSSSGGGGGGVTDALWRTRVQSKVGCTNHTMAHPKIHQNGHVTTLTDGPQAPPPPQSQPHSPPHNFCCATQAAPGVALQPAQTLLTGWVWVMEGNK